MENKHYERLDENGFVIKVFSDAFEEALETDICVNEEGGRHYNPAIRREDGLPLYKYVDGVRIETSDADFVEELKPKEVLPTDKERIDVIEVIQDEVINVIASSLGVTI